MEAEEDEEDGEGLAVGWPRDDAVEWRQYSVTQCAKHAAREPLRGGGVEKRRVDFFCLEPFSLGHIFRRGFFPLRFGGHGEVQGADDGRC